MRKKSTLKVARGRLEEDRRRSEDAFEYQRVMLFVLPLMMVAVLVVGIYFGYLSYQSNYVNSTLNSTGVKATEPEFTQAESEYLLTVVNSANPVDSTFVPELSTVDGVQVSSIMVDDLQLMLKDAEIDGLDITLLSGYISYEEQNELYNSAVANYKKKNKSSTVMAEAAVKKTTPNAGECEQQTGLVVKFGSNSDESFSKTAEFRWLQKNCVSYGFVLRYPDKENTGGLSYSPSLYRYVGKNNALSMRAYDMNLEEYVQYLGSQ